MSIFRYSIKRIANRMAVLHNVDDWSQALNVLHMSQKNCHAYCTGVSINKSKIDCHSSHSGNILMLRNNKAAEESAISSDASVAPSEAVTTAFQSLFGISEEQCKQVMQSPMHKRAPEYQMLDVLHYLHHHNIQTEQLLRVPWILLQDKGMLQVKLSILLNGKQMFLTASDGLGFCRSTVQSILTFRQLCNDEQLAIPHYRNRVYYMAEKLQITVPRMTETVARVKVLPTMSLKRINTIISLLNEHNVPREYILRDPWVFQHNIDKIRARLKESYGIFPDATKLWITRCTNDVFQKRLLRQHKNMKDRALLDKHGNSLARMVADHLGVPFELVEKRLERLGKRELDGLRATKVNDVLDVLLEAGYQPMNILTNLRIFNFSLKRISDRIALLQQMNEKQHNISVLYACQRLFDKYYTKLKEG